MSEHDPEIRELLLTLHDKVNEKSPTSIIADIATKALVGLLTVAMGAGGWLIQKHISDTDYLIETLRQEDIRIRGDIVKVEVEYAELKANTQNDRGRLERIEAKLDDLREAFRVSAAVGRK